MTPDELIRDPVFQLNLLLWMAKEQPADDWRVLPLFWQRGFQLLYIQQPFAFPVQTGQAIRASGLSISEAPEPELMLQNLQAAKGLYVEAKANSFGAASDSCKQARAHLLAAGPAFTEVYPPLECLLCYLVPTAKRPGMAKCLKTLSGELEAAKLAPGNSSVHGLAVRKGQLFYSWDTAFARHTGATGVRAAVLNGITADTNPVPLLLVYSDDDCPDPNSRDFYRHAFLERVRAILLCQLHAHNTLDPYRVALEDLLTRATEDVFRFLGREKQGCLRRLVRRNVLGSIVDRWKERQPGCFSLADDTLTIRWSTPQERNSFLDWLEDRATRFPDDRPPESSATLFPIDGPQSAGSPPKAE